MISDLPEAGRKGALPSMLGLERFVTDGLCHSEIGQRAIECLGKIRLGQHLKLNRGRSGHGKDENDILCPVFVLGDGSN
jgi:hypothetical protein